MKLLANPFSSICTSNLKPIGFSRSQHYYLGWCFHYCSCESSHGCPSVLPDCPQLCPAPLILRFSCYHGHAVVLPQGAIYTQVKIQSPGHTACLSQDLASLPLPGLLKPVRNKESPPHYTKKQMNTDSARAVWQGGFFLKKRAPRTEAEL